MAKEKREKIQKRIKEFRLFDDEFMTKCFENNIECTELVLRIIMDKSDLMVKKAHVQHVVKNLQGRSITLDIEATDSEQKKYDIEIQRLDSGAKPKRARYHSSLLDANVLLAGEDTEELPETYVIFITENDVMGKDKPIYHINRYVETEYHPVIFMPGYIDVYGDTAEIIEDCLDELQPFIYDVKPELQSEENIDFSKDDYMDCLETFLA